MITPASKSPFNEISHIPTGLPQLDRLIGGGIPTRRITEISGATTMGKTTLAFLAIAQAQQMGYKTLFADFEHSFNEDLAKTCGVDTDKLLLLRPKHAEEALDEMEEFIDKNTNALVVLDAVGAIHSRSESEKRAGEKIIAPQAGLMSNFIRKIVATLSFNNNAIIMLNHEFTDLMTGKVKTSGGAKLEYHKALWIRLRQKQGVSLKEGDIKVGKVILAEIKKNKMNASEGQIAELEMIFGKGFQAQADLLRDAMDKGVITKDKANFYLDGEKIAYGQAAMRKLLEDESFAAKLQTRV